MRITLGVFVSILLGIAILNPAVAADRVVVCEEFYQET
jgi:hypothetical protein